MKEIHAKAASGLKWTTLEQIIRQILVIVINIILARLLMPREFGLIAMIAVFTALGLNLVNSGLGTSIIRSKEVDQDDYSTVFYANVGVSILVYILIYCCAPYIAKFYKQPELILITRVFSLSIFINAFKAVQLAKLTRQMDFKIQAKAQLPAVVLAGATAIVMAIFECGVWSLVAQSLVMAITSTVLFWCFSDFKPLLRFDKEKFKTHFSYGYKLTIAGVLDAVFSNIYPLIIGRFYPVAFVGHYKQADSLSKMPVISLSNIVRKVSLPLYARVQSDKYKLKNLNKTIIQMVLLLITPVCVFAAITAPDLITVVLTSKWLPIVPYFQILCFVAILTPISSYNNQLLKAIGRSDVFLKLAIIKKVIILLCIIIGLKFGIYGLIAAQAVAAVINLGLNLYYTRTYTNYHLKDQVLDILKPILLVTFPAISMFIFKFQIFQTWSMRPRLILLLLMGSMIYFIVNEIIQLKAYMELKNLTFSIIERK